MWKIRVFSSPIIFIIVIGTLLLNLKIECISVQSRVDPDKVQLNDQFTVSCEIRRVPANRKIFAVRLQCPWSIGFEDCYENCRATCLQQQDCAPGASCLKEEFHEIGGSPDMVDFTYKYIFKNVQQRHNGTYVCRFATQLASSHVIIQKEMDPQYVTKTTITSTTRTTVKPESQKSTTSKLEFERISSQSQPTVKMPKRTSTGVETKTRLNNETVIVDVKLTSVKILGIEINDFIFGCVIVLLTIITLCAICLIRYALVRHYKGREDEAKCPRLLCIKQNSSLQLPISNSYSYNDETKLRYPSNLGAVRDIENRYYTEVKNFEIHPVYESVAASESSGSSIRDTAFVSGKPDVIVGPFLSSVQSRRNSALLRNNRGSAIVEVSLPRYQSLLQMEQQLLGFIQNPEDRHLMESTFLTPQPKRLSRRRQRRSGGSQRSVRSLGNNVNVSSTSNPRHRSVEEVYHISSNISDST